MYQPGFAVYIALDFKVMAHRSLPHLAIAALLTTWFPVSQADALDFLPVEQRAEDFVSFCRFVEEEYAYFDLKKTDWGHKYAPVLSPRTDTNGSIRHLERWQSDHL